MQDASWEKRGVRRLLETAAPEHCLTWGTAAWLSVSAREGRVQLASTTNPDGWLGASSNKAAFTDVVPRSIPRVIDCAAISAATSGALRPATCCTCCGRFTWEGGALTRFLLPHSTWRPLLFPLAGEAYSHVPLATGPGIGKEALEGGT